jgi:hypothetical protein
MSYKSYYIPQSSAEFDVFYENLVNTVLGNVLAATPVWPHIPKADAEALAADYTAWHTVYEKTLVPHTPTITAEKRRVQTASMRYAAEFVNRYLRHPPVTNEQRDDLGIPNHDPIRTPIPPPKSQVVADIDFPGIHMVELRNIRRVPGTIEDDPRSDYGVRIYYGLTGKPTDTFKFRLTEPPQKGTDLPYSVFTRRKRVPLDFEGETGNTVYFCLRYENAKAGESGVGPFGPMLTAVIP